ncbi:MAG: UDP-N-acetylmuramoyl-L-alanyl-D-glutamate--2,6-diaminopimelate ligase [Christensenellales bacterium]|jgi:UDP-N-acetylmuramoyl-L-alanyl-D-glutamate--2,6-diaminopimelate ligase
MEKTLSSCLDGVEVLEVRGPVDITVGALVMDSRQAGAGSLFFCIPGGHLDGHAFADKAVEKGAVALVVERMVDVPADVTQVCVGDSREAMARIAANFYDNPSKKLRMIAVTGTNGKTSTTYMIKAIAEAYGKKVGLIGTIANMIGDETVPADLTTPDPIQMQGILHQMLLAGVDWVVMETSAHALALRKLRGMHFDVGLFTNLTQDHLDFFGDMDTYLQAKKNLYRHGLSRSAVINGDDPHAQAMVEGIDKIPVITYGLGDGCDVRAKDVKVDDADVNYRGEFKSGSQQIHVNIPGEFTVYNSLGAAAVCALMGVPLSVIRVGLMRMPGVHGRCERLDTGDKPYGIILDYAHTPDGLENILQTVRGFAKARVITVFGCGGDRDPVKRPIMGEMAGRYSDFCVITSDNPRTEDPMAIIAAIEPGVKKTGTPYEIIENRREAIAWAMDHARDADVIVLAGKGHETYQEIDGVKYSFDEKEVVQQLLAERP